MIEPNRRMFLAGSALVAGIAASAAATPAFASGDHSGPGISPDEALARLVAGNRKFVADQAAGSDLSTARRLALAKGQHPFVALVGCADSRVGPEHLFGAGLGDLFIVRTAGNYVDDAGFGSLAYAVAELKVPLIVVLGHERCGAVAAANSVVQHNAQLPAALSRMVQPILPACIDAHARHAPGEDLLDRAVHLNVQRVVSQLRECADPILCDPIKSGHVKVVGAHYDLDTGHVDFFDRA